MRPFESYFMMVGMYACWTPMLPGGIWPSALLAALLVLHFVVEFPRWQLIIAYLTTAYTAYSVLKGVDNTLIWAIMVEVLLLISAAAACLMPVARLPTPSGPHKTLGVVSRHVDDPNTKGEMRGGMMIKIYYPAKPGSKGPKLAYTSKYVSGALATYINMPEFMLGHLPLAKSNAMQNVPIAAEPNQKLPVVIYSHGLGGHADVYSVVAEEIASHGYIVVVPTHNDLSAAYNEFPDGRILPYRPPKSLAPEAFEENKIYRNGQIKNRVVELRWMVDMLHAPNQEQLWGKELAARFDTSRIGFGGHSFGGAAVVCGAAADDRIRCVFINDPWIVPAHQHVIDGGLPEVPVMIIVSEQWHSWLDHMQTLKNFFAKCHTGSFFLAIKDTRHSNFDDVSQFSPMISQKLTATGKIPLRRGYQIIGRCHSAFLAKHLLGKSDQDEVLDPNRCAATMPEIIWVAQSKDE